MAGVYSNSSAMKKYDTAGFGMMQSSIPLAPSIKSNRFRTDQADSQPCDQRWRGVRLMGR
jgi:hypothetical protein